MKTIEYWEVTESFDRDSKLIGCFLDEAVADEVAGGKNKMYRSSYKKNINSF